MASNAKEAFMECIEKIQLAESLDEVEQFMMDLQPVLLELMDVHKKSVIFLEDAFLLILKKMSLRASSLSVPSRSNDSIQEAISVAQLVMTWMNPIYVKLSTKVDMDVEQKRRQCILVVAMWLSILASDVWSATPRTEDLKMMQDIIFSILVGIEELSIDLETIFCKPQWLRTYALYKETLFPSSPDVNSDDDMEEEIIDSDELTDDREEEEKDCATDLVLHLLGVEDLASAYVEDITSLAWSLDGIGNLGHGLLGMPWKDGLSPTSFALKEQMLYFLAPVIEAKLKSNDKKEAMQALQRLSDCCAATPSEMFSLQPCEVAKVGDAIVGIENYLRAHKMYHWLNPLFDALLSFMVSMEDSTHRMTAHRVFTSLLSRIATTSRLHLLQALSYRCSFPNAIAALVDLIRCEIAKNFYVLNDGRSEFQFQAFINHWFDKMSLQSQDQFIQYIDIYRSVLCALQLVLLRDQTSKSYLPLWEASFIAQLTSHLDICSLRCQKILGSIQSWKEPTSYTHDQDVQRMTILLVNIDTVHSIISVVDRSKK